jgi:hypothetical protein
MANSLLPANVAPKTELSLTHEKFDVILRLETMLEKSELDLARFTDLFGSITQAHRLAVIDMVRGYISAGCLEVKAKPIPPAPLPPKPIPLAPLPPKSIPLAPPPPIAEAKYNPPNVDQGAITLNDDLPQEDLISSDDIKVIPLPNESGLDLQVFRSDMASQSNNTSVPEIKLIRQLPNSPDDAELQRRRSHYFTKVLGPNPAPSFKSFKARWAKRIPLTDKELRCIPPRYGGTNPRLTDHVCDQLDTIFTATSDPSIKNFAKLRDNWRTHRSFMDQHLDLMDPFIQT